mgnify:CR=1 FL=1|jgi:hypothetical protein|tara:strand:+ start:327 stop:662 length:336 start_codon:yes stop_codon:yes gene_type:complete
MECITIYKKDLKYYMFILYVIHNFRHKGINVVFNEVINEDLWSILEPTGTHMTVMKTETLPKDKKISDGLYLSKGLHSYVKYFKDEKLLYNFNKFILVSDFEKLLYVVGKL